MKKPNKGLIIAIVLFLMFNAWAFTVNEMLIMKVIIGAIDLAVLYYLYTKYKGKMPSFLSKPAHKKEGVKNYCPECGQRVDTPTCNTCGRETKK